MSPEPESIKWWAAYGWNSSFGWTIPLSILKEVNDLGQRSRLLSYLSILFYSTGHSVEPSTFLKSGPCWTATVVDLHRDHQSEFDPSLLDSLHILFRGMEECVFSGVRRLERSLMNTGPFFLITIAINSLSNTFIPHYKEFYLKSHEWGHLKYIYRGDWGLASCVEKELSFIAHEQESAM